MNQTDVYERLELQIIRTAVLREITAYIPENYYDQQKTTIQAKVADWKLGQMLSVNPALTDLQVSACHVLGCCGLYGGTMEALARCEDLRRRLPDKQPDVEDAYEKSTGWANFSQFELQQQLGLYVNLIPDEKARLLYPSIETLGGVYSRPEQSVKAEELTYSPTPSENFADLFDPLPRAGITALFNHNGLNWKTYFERAAVNGLSEARENVGSSIRYNPFKVGEWLVKKGHYSQEQIDRKLANNLPKRSMDMKFLFTGSFDQ